MVARALTRAHRSSAGKPAITKPTLDRARRRDLLCLHVLLALSGCAALIYEVAWFQLLSFAIGTSAISLGVLLATFLGGLCGGSLLFARVVSRTHSPLKVYAVLELGIGLLGVVALYAVPAVGTLYSISSGSGVIDFVARLLVAAVCLLPPTLLMGATLPAAARRLEATREGASWLGGFYAANIAGGVFGSVLAGFYLLRVFDVSVATFVAVAINVAIVASALLLALIQSRESRTTMRRMPLVQGVSAEPPSNAAGYSAPAAPPRVAALWPIHVTTALSGLTALSCEVLWTRHLSLLLGGTVYTFALIVAVFLFGLGIGSSAGAALGRRYEPRAALGVCQLLLCVTMAWGAFATARWLPYWPIDVTLPAAAALALQLDLLRTACVVLPAALLWGASFPLALAAAAPNERTRDADSGHLIGRLYAVNTIGAIVGALATTFVLIVWLGTQRTQQLLILVAACSGLLVLLVGVTRSSPRATRNIGTAMATFLLAAALAYTVAPIPPALVAYGRFLPTRGIGANVIYVGEGLTSSIAVTREPSGILTYHNAGKTQASTYPQDMRLQRMLGHLATLVPEEPASVLVIGLGAGITAGAVSIDPKVERVVVAELEPLVSKAASEFFAGANFGVLKSSKVDLRIDDGRHFLATTDERFDAITSDPLDPWVKGAAALYTREFWELCKAHLNEGGSVTVFLQFYESTTDAVRSELATFFEAFPHGAVFANTVNGLGYDAVLLGRKDDAPIDIEGMQQRLGSAGYAPVVASLHEAGFESTIDLLATYAGSFTDMSRWLSGAEINTDRNLRLQYLAGEGLNELRAPAIFKELLGNGPGFPAQLFTGRPYQLEELRARLRATRGNH